MTWLCISTLNNEREKQKKKSSSGWKRVAADSILRLFRVPVARYKLQLSPSWSWLWVVAVRPAADSRSAGWIRHAADIYFNIPIKFKNWFCKIHHFHSLFCTCWFQLPLIQALAAASRTLKKLDEAWRSFKTLAATDSSCDGRFETCDQLTTSGILTRSPLILNDRF